MESMSDKVLQLVHTVLYLHHILEYCHVASLQTLDACSHELLASQSVPLQDTILLAVHADFVPIPLRLKLLH